MRDRKLLNIELHRIDAQQYKTGRSESGVVIVLDNVRSAYNIGSAFRTADSFGVDKVYLCGICATPPSAFIHKTALGAEDSVPWEYFEDTLSVVRALREDGYQVFAAEQTEHSVSLEKFHRDSSAKYAVIFGNEVDGVCQDVVDECDCTLEIPQQGTKHSLNVTVSVGVVLWQFQL